MDKVKLNKHVTFKHRKDWWMFLDSDLPMDAVLLFELIASWDGEFWLKPEIICKIMGISLNTLHKMQSLLIERGYIYIVYKKNELGYTKRKLVPKILYPNDGTNTIIYDTDYGICLENHGIKPKCTTVLLASYVGNLTKIGKECGMTNKDVADVLGVKYRQAYRVVDKLVESGIFEVVKTKGTYTYYNFVFE